MCCIVLGIELLTACQGMEFIRPLKTTPPLEKVYDLVRSKVKCVTSLLQKCTLNILYPLPRPMKKDRFLAPDMLAVIELLQQGKVLPSIKGFKLLCTIFRYGRWQLLIWKSTTSITTNSDHSNSGILLRVVKK